MKVIEMAKVYKKGAKLYNQYRDQCEQLSDLLADGGSAVIGGNHWKEIGELLDNTAVTLGKIRKHCEKSFPGYPEAFESFAPWFGLNEDSCVRHMIEVENKEEN